MSSEEVAQQPGSSPGGPVSREEMYAEVWRRPMTKIADHHRVSSSFLARVCARMNVPQAAARALGKAGEWNTKSSATAA